MSENLAESNVDDVRSCAQLIGSARLERAADGPPAPLWPDEAGAPVMRCLELALRTARGGVDDDAAARKLAHEIGC